MVKRKLLNYLILSVSKFDTKKLVRGNNVGEVCIKIVPQSSKRVLHLKKGLDDLKGMVK